MSEIILSNHSLSPKAFEDQCGIDIGQITSLGCISPVMVNPNTPYLSPNDESPNGQSVLAQLSAMPPVNDLANLAISFGGDNVVALAETTANLNETGSAMMGASASVYVNRTNNFTSAVHKYQSALMSYRQDIASNPAVKSASKQRVQTVFNEMQNQFKHELKTFLNQNKAHRNAPLVNVKRATNIARSSRNVSKLNVVTQAQASNVVKFSKHARYLGNGLAILDFGSRVGSVHNSYKAGGQWERDLFIESLSFAASAGTGIITVNMGSAAIGFLMVATPLGWVGLIVGGVTVAGVAAYSSIEMNSLFKNNSGDLYDNIMKNMRKL